MWRSFRREAAREIAMAGRRTARQIVLRDDEHSELEGWSDDSRPGRQWRCGHAPFWHAPKDFRARKVVAALRASQVTVGKWRGRFAEHRLDGLYDEPRSERRERSMMRASAVAAAVPNVAGNPVRFAR